MNLLNLIVSQLRTEVQQRPRPLPKAALVLLTVGYYVNEHVAVNYGVDLTPGLLVSAIVIGWLSEPPNLKP